MEFHILTIFPGMFESPFRWGVLARAIERSLVRIAIHDIREHASGPYRSTDDYPYGGGAGMVMKPEPLFKAVDAAREAGAVGPVVLLSPQGEVFRHALAKELAALPGMILICGRYEGVDDRVRQALVDREVSIGDYLLSGGELAAMVLVDAVVRLIPGVVGNESSLKSESFETGILDYPQYTRPPVFRGMGVPEVLLSGDHKAIARWRRKQALRETLRRRPDLLKLAPLNEEDLAVLETIREEEGFGG
ncbi:MAG: tRNA (guanosine(37)-N1)-methyltransferase TrmD [Thermodesulfobacteriota bacterium]